MEFVMSRVYLAYPEYFRSEINIVSTYVYGSVMIVMASGSCLKKLAKDFLQPHVRIQVHNIKEIILH